MILIIMKNLDHHIESQRCAHGVRAKKSTNVHFTENETKEL